MAKINTGIPCDLNGWPFGTNLQTIAHIKNNGRRVHILTINNKKEITEELANTSTKIVFTDLPDHEGNAFAQIVQKGNKKRGEIISLKIASTV